MSGGHFCPTNDMKRRFVPGAFNHCYQKTNDGSLLFYNISDYLMCYTLISVAASRHRVKILSLVLMPDHIHLGVIAQEESELSAFVQDYTSHFASALNRLCGREKPLFLSPFGSAPKIGDKSVRSALIYLGNNGPERKLAVRAEQHQWNFLAYYKNAHPFSEPLRLSVASRPLRRAVAIVKDRYKNGKSLKYNTLQWMFKTLDSRGRKQLTDFIISIYNRIDYESAITYFGSYDNMIAAMRITKGSEHDIYEEFTGWSDNVYTAMSQIVMEEYPDTDIHDALKLYADEKQRLATLFKERTDATIRQIEKYLRTTEK